MTDLEKRLLEQLKIAFDWLEHGDLPVSCGSCGNPDACCDGDCVIASYLSTDLWNIRRLIYEIERK